MKTQISDLLLHIKASEVVTEEPVPEHRFHKTRKWRFDFAFPYLKIAVEYEGIYSSRSGHRMLLVFVKNCEKYNEANIEGWLLLRFSADMVRSGLAIDQIERAWKIRSNKLGFSDKELKKFLKNNPDPQRPICVDQKRNLYMKRG